MATVVTNLHGDLLLQVGFARLDEPIDTRPLQARRSYIPLCRPARNDAFSVLAQLLLYRRVAIQAASMEGLSMAWRQDWLLFGCVMLGATAAWAQTGEDFCALHPCSNDAQEPPVLGDEAIQWDPLPGWLTRYCADTPEQPCDVPRSYPRCYEIAGFPDFQTVARRCERWIRLADDGGWAIVPPPTWFSPYAVDASQHPRLGELARYVVRACEGDRCGDWAPQRGAGNLSPVTFRGQPYSCFGADVDGGCQTPCYAGAPLWFSAMPVCP